MFRKACFLLYLAIHGYSLHVFNECLFLLQPSNSNALLISSEKGCIERVVLHVTPKASTAARKIAFRSASQSSSVQVSPNASKSSSGGKESPSVSSVAAWLAFCRDRDCEPLSFFTGKTIFEKASVQSGHVL